MARYFFTLTAGRTGTAWLASFMEACSAQKCIHEPFGIDELGTVMPDIKTMLTFNNRGNNEHVRRFWSGKFATIAGRPFYAETNHTLGKCGLIENIATSDIVEESKVVILRRNPVDQCLSYLVRGDFSNNTVAWQWYLWPTYRKKILSFKAFEPFGVVGIALWYCYEMSARQEYYKRLFDGKVDFIDVDLEDITEVDGGKRFFESLGMPGQFVPTSAKNKNQGGPDAALVERVRKIESSITFCPADLVDDALRGGFSFEY